MIKSFFKEFAKYSSLNVLGMLGLSCYILADTFFVAKGLGSDGLAALNLAIPVYSFIHGGGLMAGIGGGVKYAVEKSRNNHDAANRAFMNTLYICLVLALIFVFAGAFFSDAIISFMGAEGAVYDMSRTYLQVILLFAPAFILNNAQRRSAAACHGRYDCGEPFQCCSGLAVYFPMRHGDFRSGAGHRHSARYQHYHSLRSFYK